MQGDDTTLYLHVFNWPASGKLPIPGLANQVRGAYLRADPDKKALTTESSDAGLSITLPAAAPDPICSVIVLELQGPIEPIIPKQNGDGSITFLAGDAILHGKQIKQEHPDQ